MIEVGVRRVPRRCADQCESAPAPTPTIIIVHSLDNKTKPQKTFIRIQIIHSFVTKQQKHFVIRRIQICTGRVMTNGASPSIAVSVNVTPTTLRIAIRL